MIFLKLFWAFLQIGMFSVGGGYAALPLIKNQVVVKNTWLTAKEFYDIVTIAEMTPGPLAINAATFVGIKIAGIPGALVASFSTVLPSMFIVTSLALVLYHKRGGGVKIMEKILYGLRPAVIALITSAAFSLIEVALLQDEELNVFKVLVFFTQVYLLRTKKISPMKLLILTGAGSFLIYLVI